MTPIAESLQTLAKFGKQIGKISDSGKRTYMSIGQNGEKIYSTFDQDLNLVLKKISQQKQYGHKTQVFNKKGQLAKEYELINRASGDLIYREMNINTYGGVFNSQLVRKEQRIMSYKKDAVTYPYIDMANYDSNINGWKLMSTNLKTNNTMICENTDRCGGYSPYNETPNHFMSRYGFKYQQR